jgi:hypothetical protein
VSCAAAAARQEALLRATESNGWDACGGGGDAAMLEPALAVGAGARGGVLPPGAPENTSGNADAYVRPSDGAPTSSGDSAGGAAGDTGGTVSTGSGSLVRRLKWPWRGRGAAPTACSVPGCFATLEGGNGVLHKYALRHRMCLAHLRADVVETVDGPCRFCQARRGAARRWLFENLREKCLRELTQNAIPPPTPDARRRRCRAQKCTRLQPLAEFSARARLARPIRPPSRPDPVN